MGGEKEETYKNKLLSFVCQEYVKLFAEMKGAADKDDFFAAFPDIVAQAIYIAYCECFPLSIAIFDVKFQEDLAETIGEALSGKNRSAREDELQKPTNFSISPQD